MAVLFLGLPTADEGEGHDRKELGLPQAQVDLFAAVVAKQPRTVVVLVNGGALAIEPLLSGPRPAAAIVEAFYPGQGGAEATFEALLGERNTWGALPYSVYPAAFVNRSILNFDLRDDGGLTYRRVRCCAAPVSHPTPRSATQWASVASAGSTTASLGNCCFRSGLG